MKNYVIGGNCEEKIDWGLGYIARKEIAKQDVLWCGKR